MKIVLTRPMTLNKRYEGHQPIVGKEYEVIFSKEVFGVEYHFIQVKGVVLGVNPDEYCK